jgi:hypothetical protein
VLREENHEGIEVILRVGIYAESWRMLDQAQEVKYRIFGFMKLINLVMVIIWPRWKTFIKISDTVRICMYNFKRRIYNCNILMIIVGMQ